MKNSYKFRYDIGKNFIILSQPEELRNVSSICSIDGFEFSSSCGPGIDLGTIVYIGGNHRGYDRCGYNNVDNPNHMQRIKSALKKFQVYVEKNY